MALGACLLLYCAACLDKMTFEQVPRWVEDVRSERGNEVIILLVGNKVDLTEKK